MTNVLPLLYPSTYREGLAARGKEALYGPNFIGLGLDRADPEDRIVLAWLDQQTPGWRQDIRIIGENKNYFRYAVVFLFPTHYDRTQWAKFEKDRRTQIGQIKTGNCANCGALVEEYNNVETSRLAQFEFIYLVQGHRCRSCGLKCINVWPDVLFEARKAILERIGLPCSRSPFFTETIAREWRARHERPAVITLNITHSTTLEEISRMLDAGG